MNQDYNCFVSKVIKIIRTNRTKVASKAGRQVQFVFNSFNKDGCSEDKFVKLLNLAIKEKRLILIGSSNGGRVFIHKILPIVLRLGNLNSYRWTTDSGSSKFIFRPTLYVADDGLPDELTKRKKYYQTTGRKLYQIKPLKKNTSSIVRQIRQPKPKNN